jgi:hypothetical protein
VLHGILSRTVETNWRKTARTWVFRWYFPFQVPGWVGVLGGRARPSDGRLNLLGSGWVEWLLLSHRYGRASFRFSVSGVLCSGNCERALRPRRQPNQAAVPPVVAVGRSAGQFWSSVLTFRPPINSRGGCRYFRYLRGDAEYHGGFTATTSVGGANLYFHSAKYELPVEKPLGGYYLSQASFAWYYCLLK